jgi:uroporphyrinogen decarboxylase
MAVNYTGKDHVRAAYKREFTDRVPVSVWYKLGDFDEASGYSRKELRTMGDKFARYLMWLHEEIPADTITIPIGDMVMVAEGAGSNLGISQREIIDMARRGVSLLEDKSLFAGFEQADLMKGQRLPYYIEACRTVASEAGDAAVEANAYGPWTMAGLLRGNERLIYDTSDDPEFVRDLLLYETGYIRQVILQIGKTGIDTFIISDPASGLNVISPKMFREWSKPYLEEIVKFARENTDLKVCLHICGKIDTIMEDIIATGVDAVSIDSPSSLGRMVEVSRGGVVIIGNIATELFLEGTKEQIEGAVRQCVDTAAGKGGYILSSGCDIPGTKENILHFLEYGRRYGRYEK